MGSHVALCSNKDMSRIVRESSVLQRESLPRGGAEHGFTDLPPHIPNMRAGKRSRGDRKNRTAAYLVVAILSTPPNFSILFLSGNQRLGL